LEHHSAAISSDAKEICLGFVVGVAAGLILAVIMSEVRLFHTIVYPLLIATQATPIIAIAPPLVIIMGFGITPKLTIVGLIVSSR